MISLCLEHEKKAPNKRRKERGSLRMLSIYQIAHLHPSDLQVVALRVTSFWKFIELVKGKEKGLEN